MEFWLRKHIKSKSEITKTHSKKEYINMSAVSSQQSTHQYIKLSANSIKFRSIRYLSTFNKVNQILIHCHTMQTTMATNQPYCMYTIHLYVVCGMKGKNHFINYKFHYFS